MSRPSTDVQRALAACWIADREADGSRVLVAHPADRTRVLDLIYLATGSVVGWTVKTNDHLQRGVMVDQAWVARAAAAIANMEYRLPDLRPPEPVQLRYPPPGVCVTIR